MTLQLFDPSGTTLLEEAHATALGGNGFGSGETLRLHGQYLARHSPATPRRIWRRADDRFVQGLVANL